jgi:hypothetical protein
MNKGDEVFLKRGKKLQRCVVICDYSKGDPPFPAVRVYCGGDEWIVGKHELSHFSTEHDRIIHEFLKSNNAKAIVDAYAGGAKTVRAIAEKLGLQMIDVLSKFRKAKRLGLLGDTADPTPSHNGNGKEVK